MPELQPLASGYYIWSYVPSQPGSAVSAIIWVAIAILVIWRMVKTRTWFCSAFAIGCLMEFIGYCARASAANSTGKLMPFIIQSAFILLPPALFAATIYMCLGRIITFVGGEHLSPIRPSRVTKIFLTSDIVSFMVQGGSSGLTVLSFTHPSYGTIGEALVVGGLAMQLISFALFGVTALVFHSRLRRSPTARSHEVDQTWIRTMHMLYGVSILIIIRSVFRIVEYTMGTDGYPLTHEWTLYVFDTIPMFIAAVMFYFGYPSNLVPSRQHPDILLESQVSHHHVQPSKGY